MFQQSRPPYHVLMPTTLVAFFHCHEMLVATISLFVTDSSKVCSEFVQATIQKMYIYGHVASKITKPWEHLGHTIARLELFRGQESFSQHLRKIFMQFALGIHFMNKAFVANTFTYMWSTQHSCSDGIIQQCGESTEIERIDAVP